MAWKLQSWGSEGMNRGAEESGGKKKIAIWVVNYQSSSVGEVKLKEIHEDMKRCFFEPYF